MDRGFELCWYEDGEPFLWKRCEVNDCPNKVCHRRSTKFCYPHSEADKSFTESIMKTKVPVPA